MLTTQFHLDLDMVGDIHVGLPLPWLRTRATATDGAALTPAYRSLRRRRLSGPAAQGYPGPMLPYPFTRVRDRLGSGLCAAGELP